MSNCIMKIVQVRREAFINVAFHVTFTSFSELSFHEKKIKHREY